MPAGTYTFSRDGQSILALHGSTADAHALSMVRPETRTKAPTVGRITFNKYGDHYFLHGIATSDSATAYECPTTSQEKALIRELTANQVAVNVMPNLH
jgi:hypothetical protein